MYKFILSGLFIIRGCKNRRHIKLIGKYLRNKPRMVNIMAASRKIYILIRKLCHKKRKINSEITNLYVVISYYGNIRLEIRGEKYDNLVSTEKIEYDIEMFD